MERLNPANRQSTEKHNTLPALRWNWFHPNPELQFHPNPAKRQSTKKHNTYQLCVCVYGVPPDDGLQIFPKHIEVDWRNKLRINSASSWFSLHGCIEMHGQQNKKVGKFLRPQPLLMQIWYTGMSVVGTVAAANSLFPISNLCVWNSIKRRSQKKPRINWNPLAVTATTSKYDWQAIIRPCWMSMAIDTFIIVFRV